MQVSKKKMNGTLERQLFLTLFQMIADLKDPAEVETMLKGFLSDTELLTLAKRLAIGYWLTKGRSYENIKENLKVSSATVAEVQQNLKATGWKLAIQKITAEEWASQWEQKIKSILKRT